jgi:hypothetical protein
VPLAVSGYAESVAVGDLNSDGLKDVVVGVSSTGNDFDFADQLVIFLGDGKGGFPSSVTLTSVAGVTSFSGLGTGDFDGDGLTDLAIATDRGLLVLYGQSDGGLNPSASYALTQGGSCPCMLRVADLNGDGVSDVAMLANQSAVLDVFIAKVGGGFEGAVALTLPDVVSSADGLATGDVDGDGLADLAVTYPSPANFYTDVLALYLQKSGALQFTASGPAGEGALLSIGGEVISSFDDGDISLNSLSDGGVLTIVTDLATITGEGWGGISVDLNGDGASDIVASVEYETNVYVFMAHDGGAFYGGGVILASGIESLGRSFVASDLNGDGRPDIAEGDSNGGAVVLLNGCAP